MMQAFIDGVEQGKFQGDATNFSVTLFENNEYNFNQIQAALSKLGQYS